MRSPYAGLPEFAPDPIFGLSAEYKDDPRKDKCTFITGYYRDEHLQTPLLQVVAEAEEELAKRRVCREYLPIGGDGELVELIGRLAFGQTWDPEKVAGIQTVGGTGALYLAGVMAAKWTKQIYISSPTWINHYTIFDAAGLRAMGYPYYQKGKLLFDEMLEELSTAAPESAVLLHVSGHNPSGLDFSKEEWSALVDVLKKKKLYPILDLAYQGFSHGLDADAFGVRHFMEAGVDFALAYTCAKNFSLYSERVGALFVVDQSGKMKKRVAGYLQKKARGRYSNPPFHGGHIVKMILGSPKKKEAWQNELKGMRKRIQGIRKDLAEALPNHADVLSNGSGLFFYSELSPKAIDRMKKENGLYLASDGRVNLTGIGNANQSRFVEAFLEAEKLSL